MLTSTDAKPDGRWDGTMKKWISAAAEFVRTQFVLK
jgi:hypothetical protein